MSLSKTVVGRPTTILIIFGLLVGFGLYTVSDVAIDLYPEIDPPVLILFTNYSGAGPEEVEKTITRTLEGQLASVSNIEQLSSTSSEGSSQIVVEFSYGTNMTEATNEIRDRLEFVKDFLPDEASTPQIFKFDPSFIPVLQLEVSGNRSPEELRQIAQDAVQPRIEQVEGVALAGVRGGRDKIVRIEISQNRMEAYNLNFTQIAGILRGNNVQLSAGSISEGNVNYLVRTAGEYKSIDEIKNTVVTYAGTPPSPLDPDARLTGIRLRDLANVYEGFTDESNTVFINGDPGVFVVVQKQSGTNSVRVSDSVISRLDDINRSLPRGVQVGVVQDTTEIIRNSLRDVSSSAITGALLAVLILLIFLRSVRTTLVIAVSIPVSIVVTLMVMYFAGLTLNLMTLTGLALGVGMLVDNSIVVLENIYRYREKGAKLTSSAILGSQEMVTAIMASTLTTVFVFVPLAIFRSQLEVIGELFSDLAFTVVISLLSSLAVAVFLIPVLSSRYLPIYSRKQRPLHGIARRFDDLMESFFTSLDTGYKRVLSGAIRFRYVTLVLILAVFGGSLALIPSAGFEFVPDQGSDSVTLNVELPVGTKLDVTRAVLRQLEIVAQDEVDGYSRIITEAGEPAFFGVLGSADTSKGSLTVTLPPFDERRDDAETIEQKLRAHFDDFPSVLFEFGDNMGGGGGALGGSPVVIKLRSEDLELMRDTGNTIVDLLQQEIPEATEPQINLSDGLPQVEIKVDRAKAYELGLNMSTIGQEVRANIDGITAGKYRTGGNEYDILVVLDERNRDQIPDLQKVFVLNNRGARIPLSSIATFERTTGPVSISRVDQSRSVEITAGLAPGSTVNVIMPRVVDLIEREIPADENLVIEYGGDLDDLMNYGKTFVLILIVSILLVFGVMASQFESFLDPFIIIFTIPLTAVGVVAIYVLTNTNFSIFTAVGMVMLAGIVVNNGIVLVDYTNLLRKRGYALKEACVAAGGNRLRPILMTSLTTVLGLVPVAFAKGEGASLVQPIAKSVVGGLTAATFLTLFLIPVLYYMFNRVGERRDARRKRRSKRRRAKDSSKPAPAAGE